MSRYIVIRPAPDLPAGYLPDWLDGYWAEVDPFYPVVVNLDESSHAVAVPTGRYETRDSDGATAEIWEVQET